MGQQRSRRAIVPTNWKKKRNSSVQPYSTTLPGVDWPRTGVHVLGEPFRVLEGGANPHTLTGVPRPRDASANFVWGNKKSDPNWIAFRVREGGVEPPHPYGRPEASGCVYQFRLGE